MKTSLYLALAAALSLSVSAQTTRGTAGEWGTVIKWPHVPAHIVQLNDGKMLTWAAATADDFNISAPNNTIAAVYNPNTGSFLQTPNPRQNMFCAGLCRTIDGKTMAVGGGAATTLTSLFNPANNTWSSGGDNRVRRWYSTAVTMPNGTIFSTLGSSDLGLSELWSPTSNVWTPIWPTDLTPVINDFKRFSPDDYEWYPWLHVAPNGKLFLSGPTDNMYWIDPNGTSTDNVALIGPRVANDRMRLWGTSMMYRPGQLFITGGRDSRLTPPATNEAMVININGATPVVTKIAPMNYARVFHYTVALPNGEVLALGGNTSALKFTDEGSILTPEMWNPNTNTWRLLAPMSVARPYHAASALMKDGRVLIIGGGTCGPCGANHPDGQIYSPPYLFNSNGTTATRPTMADSDVPNTVRVGASFTVRASSAVTNFNLVRLQSTTHGMQTDARFIPLTITGVNRGSTRSYFTLATPNNANVLVPGDYWLFAVNPNGTPSVGVTIRVN